MSVFSLHTKRWAGLIEIRAFRHLLFWVSWVVGFTFIKSFGQPLSTYGGWFAYYMITLPIFVTHTYLIAYVLIPYLLNKRLFPLFILLFILFFYGYSVLELLLSNELIFNWAPTGSEVSEDYLKPVNVVRSGLGNLYIVLVFLAAKTIRNWFLADHRQKELQKVELQMQMNDAVSRVQPSMLLYAIDNIEDMVDRKSPEVTRAIALTSELLSDVMIFHGKQKHIFSEEIELVRKLISLVSLFRGSKPEVEFFISGDPGKIDLPSMILFSLMDLIFRKYHREDSYPEINIEASGFANLITIQILHTDSRKQENTLEQCIQALQQLECYFRDRITISVDTHEYGCSVVIRNLDNPGVNTIHSYQGAVGAI
jgi:hypothetical protein